METLESIIEYILPNFLKNVLLIFVIWAFFCKGVAIFWPGLKAVVTPEGVIECESLLLFVTQDIGATRFCICHVYA